MDLAAVKRQELDARGREAIEEIGRELTEAREEIVKALAGAPADAGAAGAS
jgi:ribose 1,5-bisphosphokinase PhnN